MLLSIIVINYKTVKLTSDCLKSLHDSLGNRLIQSVEIIVVDNGSGNAEVKKLQKLRDELGFKLLTSEKNLGFAAGCNFGAELSEGELLLFLNSDTKNHTGVIEMADVLKNDSKIGVLGGRIVKSNGKTEKSAGKFYNLWNLFLMLFLGERLDTPRVAPKDYQKVEWVSGGFMMVRKDAFDKALGFDEDYFMYLEDMDLCMRLKKLGFWSYYFPKASVVHLEHGSASRQFAIVNIYKSLIIFYGKNKSGLYYHVAIMLLRLKAGVSYLIGRLMGKREIVQTYSEVLKLF